MTEIVYVYGTLRPGTNPTIRIEGTMYSVGSFPGVKLGGNGSFAAERVAAASLAVLDAYEGYDPTSGDLSSNLYVRRRFRDGWIYEYNQEVAGLQEVSGGDWLAFRPTGDGWSASSLLAEG